MLQSGVMTRDLDVRWVSSLSWYFLNLFGLQSVFIFILGNDNGKPPFPKHFSFPFPSFGCKSGCLDDRANALRSTAANQMAQQMSQMNPSAAGQMFQPGQDPDKAFLNEAENLEVLEHECILNGVEERLLASLKAG